MASTNIDVITKSDPHTDELQAISFTVHYPNGSASCTWLWMAHDPSS
jgi:hypothetical protein